MCLLPNLDAKHRLMGATTGRRPCHRLREKNARVSEYGNVLANFEKRLILDAIDYGDVEHATRGVGRQTAAITGRSTILLSFARIYRVRNFVLIDLVSGHRRISSWLGVSWI